MNHHHTHIQSYKPFGINSRNAHLIAEALQPYLKTVNKPRLSPEGLMCKALETVSVYYSVPVEAMKAKTRKRHIVKPRQIAMYLMREVKDVTLKMVGEIFSMDHTSIVHSVQTVKNLMHTDRDYRLEVEEIKLILNS